MSITLSDGVTTLTLPGDLAWTDEYTWSPVVQESGYSLTGALIIETASKLAGRPITLQGAADCAWITRAMVNQLSSWRDVPGQQLTITLRGTARTVTFRHEDAPVIEADPILFYGDPIDDDDYRATIKLMEI